ncbi:MAG: hypothetical protein IKI97_01630, partial [Clostridia bacterium]|nr:hypothetical protein [Clostridia bacterium]
CLDAKFPVRVISPDDGYYYFFGYYDLNAYHENGKYHLANRVKFMDRLPTKDDVCELGYIDLETKEFTKFAETTAWNFQQGALMSYNKANYDEVFYNVRGGEYDYQTCIHNLKTGKKRYTDRACANVSLDGKLGLAVNFNRIYDFRPGYGYSDVKDKWYDVPQPDDDGVYLVDMETGKSKLILSIADCLKQFPNEMFPDKKFVINHITFNPSANRFLFLLRNFQEPTAKTWLTTLITSDLEGNMYELIHNGFVSHYHWKNDSQVMFYCECDDIRGVHLLDDLSHNYTTYADPDLTFDKKVHGETFNDIHCLYSPNQRYFIGDGYPRPDHCRHIYLYDTVTDECEIILKDYTWQEPIGDIRCDLHNRWNVKGDKISFDSTRNVKREICEIDVSTLEHN